MINRYKNISECERKEETIYVMSGDDNTDCLHLPSGMVYHVKPNQIHRFRFGDEASSVMLMEVSTNYLNDVVRIEDDYKR